MLPRMRSLGVVSSIGAASLLVLVSVLGCARSQPEPEEAEHATPAPGLLVQEYEKARRDAMCIDAQNIAMAVEMQLLRNPGACPADVEMLVAKGLLARVPASAPSWSIVCSETGPIVSAPGVDGRLGTRDDVVQGGPDGTCKVRP
jgi:hypothetical protein